MSLFAMRSRAFVAKVATVLLVSVCGAAIAAEPAEPPELHSVTHIGSQTDRLILVRGVFTEKPRVRVGGRRARVKEWTSDSLTVKVSRRVSSGFHAVEAESRGGAAHPPLALHYAGVPPGAKRLRFRKKRDRPQRFRKAELAVDHPAPGLVSIVFSRRESYRYKVTTCTWFRVCIFGECTDRCDTHAAYGSRFWFVGLQVPLDAIALGPGSVSTSVDDGALIGYANPRSVYSTAKGEDDRWWIVIGRDEYGVISGQYRGIVTNDKGRKFRISGRFALPTDS